MNDFLFEDLHIYLPSYLNLNQKGVLFNEIRNFCETCQVRGFYSEDFPSESLLQGDVVDCIPVYNYEGACKNSKVMILSNSCDMNQENQRMCPKNVCYAPLISLELYLNKLKDKFDLSRVEQFEVDVKRQRLSHILYLPRNSNIPDSIVLFDRMLNLNRDQIGDFRLFCLSNFGFYFMLIKLSYNFNRLHEDIDRST